MKKSILSILVVLILLILATTAFADSNNSRNNIIGSWFGRATPVDPFCEPGSEGCPLPAEIIMTPTFFADGVFMGSDHLTFFTPRTAGHGSWIHTSNKTMEATMVIIQADDAGNFIGAFRVRFAGELVSQDLLEGLVNVHFFPFVDVEGNVVLDPDNGHPIPDPLTPLGEFITDSANCSPAMGCLGLYEFSVRRITPLLDQG
jgi:hypothetical protein